MLFKRYFDQIPSHVDVLVRFILAYDAYIYVPIDVIMYYYLSQKHSYIIWYYVLYYIHCRRSLYNNNNNEYRAKTISFWGKKKKFIYG